MVETDSGDRGTGWSCERNQSCEVREKCWGGLLEGRGLLKNAICRRSVHFCILIIALSKLSWLPGFSFVLATITMVGILSKQRLLSAAPCPLRRLFLALSPLAAKAFKRSTTALAEQKAVMTLIPLHLSPQWSWGPAATERKAPRLISLCFDTLPLPQWSSNLVPKIDRPPHQKKKERKKKTPRFISANTPKPCENSTTWGGHLLLRLLSPYGGRHGKLGGCVWR